LYLRDFAGEYALAHGLKYLRVPWRIS